MAKYDEQFKLTVVQAYLSEGSAGYRAMAKRHGLASHTMLETWVMAYRLHGSAGLSKKFSSYSAEFKLSVLQHMWDNQLSMIQTAARFDIRSRAMVGIWERAYRDGGLDALIPRPRGRPKAVTTPEPSPAPDRPRDDAKLTREQLLAEVQQLRMELAYTKKLQALVQARQQQVPQKKRK
jgi:transposase